MFSALCFSTHSAQCEYCSLLGSHFIVFRSYDTVLWLFFQLLGGYYARDDDFTQLMKITVIITLYAHIWKPIFHSVSHTLRRTHEFQKRKWKRRVHCNGYSGEQNNETITDSFGSTSICSTRTWAGYCVLPSFVDEKVECFCCSSAFCRTHKYLRYLSIVASPVCICNGVTTFSYTLRLDSILSQRKNNIHKHCAIYKYDHHISIWCEGEK